jgi:hypothetical protein
LKARKRTGKNRNIGAALMVVLADVAAAEQKI